MPTFVNHILLIFHQDMFETPFFEILPNFRKLLHGRVDLFPSSIINARALLNQNFTEEQKEKLNYHEHPLTEQTGHLLFPRGYETSRKLLEAFNRGLEELKDESMYEELFRELIEPYE